MAAGCDKASIDYNVYLLNTVDNSWKTAGKISVDLCGSGLVCHGRMLIFTGGSSTHMSEQAKPTGSIFIYRPMY
jgi:N-acetylneuraminic acid mutarotase